MDYKIVEKSAFTIMGRCRRFNANTSYEEIPKYWDEHFATGGGETVVGMFGACIDGDGKEFDYLIADIYYPWREIPEGYETRIFEAGTWAVFRFEGDCPKALQDLNTQIWSEWLPNSKEYELAANYNFEFYKKTYKKAPTRSSELWSNIDFFSTSLCIPGSASPVSVRCE